MKLDDDALLAELGLARGGDLTAMDVYDTYGGQAVNAVVFDITVTKKGESESLNYLVNHGCGARNGWNTLGGSMRIEASVFVNVLEYEDTGDSGFRYDFVSNAGPGISVNGGLLGQGWKHQADSKGGLGGCLQTYVRGTGHIKFAMVLPYLGLGDHGGHFVWAPFFGSGSAHWWEDDLDLLDVTGAMTVNGQLHLKDNGRQVLLEERNDIAGWQLRAPSDNLYLSTDASQSGVPVVTMKGHATMTKVGIGTTEPGAKLEVSHDNDGTVQLLRLRNADATFSQTVDFSLNTMKDLVITGGSGAGGVDFRVGTRGVNFDGNVGVGTGIGAATLHANACADGCADGKRVLEIGGSNHIAGIRLESLQGSMASSYEIWGNQHSLHFDTMNTGRDFTFNSGAEEFARIEQGTGNMAVAGDLNTKGGALRVKGVGTLISMLCVLFSSLGDYAYM